MREITLHSRKYPGLVTLVDDDDYDWLNQYRWYPLKSDNCFYAIGLVTEDYNQRMHAIITGYEQTDHMNRNGLDNQRHNLRPATPAQNAANRAKTRGLHTSAFKGVSWNSRQKGWKAGIVTNGKRTHLGYFTDEIDAALAYDQAAREQHGEYGVLNFPDVHDYRHLTSMNRSQSSRYRGVSWHRRQRKWNVVLCINGTGHYVGSFVSEIVAAIAYDRAARDHFGENAHTNFGNQSDYILAA